MYLIFMNLFKLLILLPLCKGEKEAPEFLVTVSSPDVPPANFCGVSLTGYAPHVKLSLIRGPVKAGGYNVTSIPYALYSNDGTVNTSIRPPPYLLVVPRTPENMATSLFIMQVDGDSLSNHLAKIDAKRPGSAILSTHNRTLPDSFTRPLTSAYLTALIINLYPVVTILLGSLLVIIRRHEILEAINTRSVATKTAWTYLLFVIIIVAVMAGGLVLTYYFYDVMVYFYIAWFVVISTTAIAATLTILISSVLPALGKRLPVKFNLGRRQLDRSVSPLFCCLLLVGAAYMITWVVYRNDRRIGWNMQSVSGTVTLAWILYYLLFTSVSPSLKVYTVLFSIVVLYDVVFVFFSPYFVSKEEPPGPENGDQLTRTARSSGGGSIMEDVATGKAGRSGELIPLVFRITLEWVGPLGVSCPSNRDISILGFGDAVIPGALCTYTALYDWLWKVRYRYNFLGTLTGYLLGLVITNVVLYFFHVAQPALLYLCPCTLLVTVLCALCFGGRQELVRLWTGALPASGCEFTSHTSVNTATLSKSDEGAESSVTIDSSEVQLILPTVAVLPDTTGDAEGSQTERLQTKPQ